ncbi:MAG: type 4a pilus biogenesis protein PilO [Methylococcales bacterium]|nr:type 4a pilus biogenesis protein PilO [Methylococcales bacterium]MCK5924290.1 type 4a pilus biogenesis protein PilO [Methylococcales bacterium]
MNLSEVDWDYRSAGSWPLEVKIFIIFIICCLLAGGGIYQFTLKQVDEWNKLEATEADLRLKFESNQKQSANLTAYKKQLSEIEASLGNMIKQMPSKAEVAALLRKISNKAKEIGLEIQLFETQLPIKKEFYYEVPSQLEVLGTYEQVGFFISSLSTLPRIVTVHDVSIELQKIAQETYDGRLVMKAIIKTYNEASESEEEEDSDDET